MLILLLMLGPGDFTIKTRFLYGYVAWILVFPNKGLFNFSSRLLDFGELSGFSCYLVFSFVRTGKASIHSHKYFTLNFYNFWYDGWCSVDVHTSLNFTIFCLVNDTIFLSLFIVLRLHLFNNSRWIFFNCQKRDFFFATPCCIYFYLLLNVLFLGGKIKKQMVNNYIWILASSQSFLPELCWT